MLTLDASGETIPDTDYPIPSGAIFLATNGSDANPGTEAQPVATLNKAISLVGSGTIVVRGGRYRDWYNTGAGAYKVSTNAFTLQAYPHEQVWFDGTDVKPASAWTSDGAGHWSMPWSTPQFCNNGYYTYRYDQQPTSNDGPCSHFDMGGDPATNPAGADPQMVFVDGAYVHEVTSLAEVTGNGFFYDWDNRVLYIASDPATHLVEVAARPVALIEGGNGPNVIRGIGFTRYASNEQNNTTGAAVKAAASSLVENCVFTRNAGQGLSMGEPGAVVRHSVLAFNGFNGMGSNGHQHSSGAYDGLVVQDSVINANNQENLGTHCSASCAQAGIKLGHMDSFTIEDNIFENNNGAGFWCDLACSHGVMIRNVSRNNQGDGLFYEVSDTGILASNLVVGNYGYGIRVGSANSYVVSNTVVNNNHYGALWIYDDSRSYGFGGWTDVGPDTVNTTVLNNVLVDTVGSNTLHRITAASTVNTNTQPAQFFTAFDYNAYYRTTANQYLVRWIPSAGEIDYRSASAFTAAQGWDAHASDVSDGGDPFVDLAHGDFHLQSSSPAYQSATDLPADVAAALGVPASATRSRGAITWPGE